MHGDSTPEKNPEKIKIHKFHGLIMYRNMG
jgi:hypothetical protein